MRVLVIEKNRDLLESIENILKKKDITPVCVFDGVLGLDEITRQKFDCIILDAEDYRISNSEIIKKTRQLGISAPFICTSLDGINKEEILIKNTNFSEYLFFPFDSGELINVIENISTTHKLDNIIIKDLEMDYENFMIKYKDLRIHLTLYEILVLRELLENNYVEQEKLLDIIHSPGNMDNDLYIYINVINKKLEALKYNYKIIRNGMKYKVELIR